MEPFFKGAPGLENGLFYQFSHSIFVAIKHAYDANGEQDDFAPTRVVQVLFDKIAAIFAQHQFSCREILFEVLMKEAVALFAALDQYAGLTAHRCQDLFRTLCGFYFIASKFALQQLFHNLFNEFVFWNSSNGRVFVHPEGKWTKDFHQFGLTEMACPSACLDPRIYQCVRTEIEELDTMAGQVCSLSLNEGQDGEQ